MKLLFSIAATQLLDRKRQSIVSLLGIVLGVAFFLAISSLMQGSQKDFIRRLIDNSPHVTVTDEFRNPGIQPVIERYPDAAVELRNLTPLNETRGVRAYERILAYLRNLDGVRASAVLLGQALVSYAGRDYSVTLNGMVPEEIAGVTTIESYMQEGSIENLIVDSDGVIIGGELARKVDLKMGDSIQIATTTGQIRLFKVVGIFSTGRSAFDEKQVFVKRKRVQAMLNRPRRINSIIVKLPDPDHSVEVAAQIEARSGFKSVSWQESSQDILDTLVIRNVIMYTVVSAVLLVAAFGIYNVISTVVLEKRRDIAILKSMGFYARDIQQIFLMQGVVLGICGCLFGVPFGMGLMYALMQVRFRPPGATEPISMPIDWGLTQFLIAIAFAMLASIVAAYLPARKAASVQPVDILRGGAF